MTIHNEQCCYLDYFSSKVNTIISNEAYFPLPFITAMFLHLLLLPTSVANTLKDLIANFKLYNMYII